MARVYQVAVDFNDDGNFTGVDEALASDVLALEWRIGLARADEALGAPVWARVTLDNVTRQHTPEYAAHDLRPGHRLRIQVAEGALVTTLFTGILSSIAPAAGVWGTRSAIIEAVGVEAQLAAHVVRLPAQVNVTADAVIDAVLDAVPLRRALLAGYWILGRNGHMTLDSSTRLAETTAARSLQTGKSTLAYVGDTWARGVTALAALREVVEAERGRFFTDRDGTLVFYNRHHLLLKTAAEAAFDDTMSALNYRYGEAVYSGVQVTVRPRSVGPADGTLWVLEAAQRLEAQHTQRLLARFRDAQKRPIGALDVLPLKPGSDYSANTQPDGSGADRTASVVVRVLEADFSAALLEVANLSKQTVYLQAGATLRGRPLLQGDPLTVEHSDPLSLTLYGPRMLVFDLPALTSLQEADDLALFEMSRRAAPRGLAGSVVFDSRMAADDFAGVLARTLFDRVTIQETQTNHTGDYFIVAEQHRVEQGGTQHRVEWLLESTGPSAFFVVGASAVDAATTLAY